MKIWTIYTTLMCCFSSLYANQTALPKDLQKIMQQPKYTHSSWGIYVKNLEIDEILYDYQSDLLFLPASTTKLVSMAALLDAYGENYHFKTPVYATGPIQNGQIEGDLVLVAQGDLTMGGRQGNTQTIAFKKMDHSVANHVPGALLTEEDPLYAFHVLAKQIAEKGIHTITGTVKIDDSLFETIEKRGTVLSPIMINENLIDFIINPSEIGEKARIVWRPQVSSYSYENNVKTVAKGDFLNLEVKTDAPGKKIVIEGTIPLDAHNVIRTSPILDPVSFAQQAFIEALQKEGIKITSLLNQQNQKNDIKIPLEKHLVALWTSPSLSEYVKLILKVSHNTGANLVPLLLAVKQGKKSFDEGMKLIGNFLEHKVKLSPQSFVLLDGAGGDENRLTPQAEVKLLKYMYQNESSQFKAYFDALPILGVDGSLEDFAKKSPAAGHVRAKPGTGVLFNLATNQFFLTTQALSGYIQSKQNHLWAYMVVVNNGAMSSMEDIFPIFEDVSQMSNLIYEHIHQHE